MNTRTQWHSLSDQRASEYSGNSLEWSHEAGEQNFEAEVPNTVSESAVVADSVRAGKFDENQITNGIFFQRHSDRAGRAIAPDERQLIAEWVSIRDRIVRPALQAAGITPIDPRPYRFLLPILNRYRGNIPLEFLFGWIAVESGGRIDVITSIDERGYFQFHPGESAALRVDHQRLSNDAEYSVQMGIELVKFRVSGAAKFGFVPGSELYWTVGKLLHWLPLGVQFIVDLMQKKGFHPNTWEEFRKFTLDNRLTILSQLKARPGSNWDPAVGIANVDKVLRRGRQITQMLGQP